MTGRTARCLRVPLRRPAASWRLVIFPHAGGGASFYRSWSGHSGPEVEVQVVQYPGREDRLAEPLVDHLPLLVDEVVDALRATDDGRVRTALLGHSMGSAVAYETAVALDRGGGARVTDLFVSGRCAPGVVRSGPPGRRTDEKVLDAVRRLGGTPPELLAEPSFRELFLRVLANDHVLVDSYRHSEGCTSADLTALWSREDPQVDAAGVAGWRQFTTGRYRELVFAGGHFYLVAAVGEIMAAVRAQLGARPGPR